MKKILLFILSFFTYSFLYAQNPCGYDHHQKEYIKEHPHALDESSSFQDLNTTTVYKIPVVFMVAHTGQNEGEGLNLSRTNLLRGIHALNDWFKTSGTLTDSAASAGTTNIEFVLATVDKDGNAFDGVLRSDCSAVTNYNNGVNFNSGSGSGTTASAIVQKFDTDHGTYNASDYYRVYIVNHINGAYAFASTGYAFMPTYSLHGATFAHETGHYLSLPHTFQGGGTNSSPACPSNADCTVDGDGVCDTPPQSYPTTTTIGTQDCTNSTFSTALKFNFMNYFQSPILFTQGQVDKMRGHIQNNTDKQNLILNQKSIAIGTPTADFHFNNSCSSQSISFLELSENGPTSWSWDFGDNTSSTLKNPSHTFANEGTYSVTLTVQNSFGTATKTKVVEVKNNSQSYPNPSTNGWLGYDLIEAINFGNHIITEGGQTNGYHDTTCETFILNAGSTYNGTFAFSSPSDANSTYAIYADLNHDGKFDGLNEKLGSGIKSSSGAYKDDFSYTIPQTALSNTKVRVRILMGDASNDVRTTSPTEGTATLTLDMSAIIYGGTTSSDFAGHPTNISDTGFNVGWSAPSGTTLTPSNYYLDVAYDEDFSAKVSGFDKLEVTNGNNLHTLANLKTGATYYFRLIAKYASDNNYEVYSSSKKVKTVQQYDSNQVQHISIATSSTEALIRWTEGSNSNTILQISDTPYEFTLPSDGSTYTNNSSAGTGKTWWLTNEDSIVINGLSPEQTYFVRAFDYTGTDYNTNVGTESIKAFSTSCDMSQIDYAGGQGHPYNFSLSTLSFGSNGSITTPVINKFGDGAAFLKVDTTYNGSYSITANFITKGYIDFDQDGNFDDNEEVFDTSSQQGNTSQTFSINISDQVPAGIYTLRISTRYNVPNLTGCGGTGYGGATDIQVIISNSNCIPNSLMPDLASLPTVNDTCQVTAITAPTATTNCGQSISGTTTTTFPITSATTITWNFTDGNGHYFTQTQDVTILDLDSAVSVSTNTLTANLFGSNITYQWYDCSDNSMISGATMRDFTPTADGDYKVKISNGTCEIYSNCHSFTMPCSTTSITPLVSNLDTLTYFCQVDQLTAPKAVTNCGDTLQAMLSNTIPLTSSTNVTWNFSSENITFTQTQQINLFDTVTITQASGTLEASITGSNLSFQWYSCNDEGDQSISEATNRNFTPTASGSYKVVIIANSSCTLTSACFDFTITSLEEDLWTDKVYIYPNPSQQIISIGGLEKRGISFKIFSQNGQQIQGNTEGNQPIDVTSLQSGLYIIQLKDEKNVKSLKFIKK